eukprot:2824614-Rhodomonas_salina.1
MSWADGAGGGCRGLGGIAGWAVQAVRVWHLLVEPDAKPRPVHEIEARRLARVLPVSAVRRLWRRVCVSEPDRGVGGGGRGVYSEAMPTRHPLDQQGLGSGWVDGGRPRDRPWKAGKQCLWALHAMPHTCTDQADCTTRRVRHASRPNTS